MQTSQSIARLAGPVLCVVGIGMLASEAAYREIATQFFRTLPFIYLSGMLLLVAGLSILNAHHAWTPDWRSAITVLGWLLTGIGAFRVIAPPLSVFVAGTLIATGGFFIVAGLLLLAFGGFLTFKGYVA
jgi:hypothetical protein